MKFTFTPEINFDISMDDDPAYILIQNLVQKGNRSDWSAPPVSEKEGGDYGITHDILFKRDYWQGGIWC